MDRDFSNIVRNNDKRKEFLYRLRLGEIDLSNMASIMENIYFVIRAPKGHFKEIVDLVIDFIILTDNTIDMGLSYSATEPYSVESMAIVSIPKKSNVYGILYPLTKAYKFSNYFHRNI